MSFALQTFSVLRAPQESLGCRNRLPVEVQRENDPICVICQHPLRPVPPAEQALLGTLMVHRQHSPWNNFLVTWSQMSHNPRSSFENESVTVFTLGLR